MLKHTGMHYPMGDIHTLPTSPDASARLLERIVIDSISACPDQRVADRWAQLASETLGKHPSPPAPSCPVLDLTGAKALDEQSRKHVQELAAAWMESYFNDVQTSMMAMHKDLLKAQKYIAELEIELADRTQTPG